MELFPPHSAGERTFIGRGSIASNARAMERNVSRGSCEVQSEARGDYMLFTFRGQCGVYSMTVDIPRYGSNVAEVACSRVAFISLIDFYFTRCLSIGNCQFPLYDQSNFWDSFTGGRTVRDRSDWHGEILPCHGLVEGRPSAAYSPSNPFFAFAPVPTRLLDLPFISSLLATLYSLQTNVDIVTRSNFECYTKMCIFHLL